MKISTQAKGILFLIISTFIFKNSYSQNCSVNAGVTTTLCVGDPFILTGNLSGPSMSGTVIWSVQSQPGGASVIFDNPESLLANGGLASVAGTYVFRLSATCGNGVPVFNDVTYIVNPKPGVPAITGTTAFSCYVTGTAINITGTTPGPGETAMWRVLGGNGGTFGSATSSTTTFTPSFPENECSSSAFPITLEYSLTNASGCRTAVTSVYTFSRNYGLSAFASVIQVCGTSTNLFGSCPGTGTVAWTVVTKPSGAPDPVFTPNATSRNTSVSGLVTGNYTFRYTVTGGCSPGSVDVNIVVAGTSPLTQADAGQAQNFCTIPGTVSLTGNNAAIGETVTWSQLSGGTSASFSSPASSNTTATGLTDAGAPYAFIYTISNGICSSSDTVNIYKIPGLTLTSTDVSTCMPASSALSSNVVKFGNYLINTLDTVKVNVTFLSGPAGSGSSCNVLMLKGRETNNTTTSRPQQSISIGQTRSFTIYGSDLYHPLSAGSAASGSYYLTNSIFTTLPGIHKFKFIYTTKCGSYEKEINIFRGYTGTGVNAGTDLLVPCNATTAILAGSITSGEGLWRTVQMPAGATDPITASNASLQSPPLSGLIPGTYIFRHTRNPGPNCNEAKDWDDVKLVVANNVPIPPNAGADKTSCAGTISLSGSAIPSDAAALWTVVSPAGSGVTFSDATIANPSAIGLQPLTTYVFRYTFSNACGSQQDDVTITTTSNVNPAKPVITSTGIVQCGSQTRVMPVTVAYDITHPPFTAGEGIDSTWRIFGYPANPAYTISHLSTTSTRVRITFTQQLAVSVVYTLSNANCPGEAQSDTISFAMKPASTFTTSAGAPQQFCAVNAYPLTATITGSETDNLPAVWSHSYSSNGLPITIADPNSRSTEVTLPANGVYRFRYQVQSPLDPSCPNLGEGTTQIITASPGSIAIAGNDIDFCNSTGITNLAATTLSSGTGQWELYKLENGVAPIITTPSSATSQIQFSQSGKAIFKWSSYGNNPECGSSSSDLVTVTYIAPAKAGNDQQLCKSTSATLNALSPTPATGVWTKVSGPSATIADASSPQTVVTGLTPGSYVFRWSVTAPPSCSSTDDVSIVVSEISDVANAGVDFPSCSGGSNTIRLNAAAAPAGFTGTWALVTKPSGAATGSFNNIHNEKSTYSGVNMPGKYSFSWTISNGVCSSTDFVEVTAGTTGCTLPVILSNFYGAVNFNCNVELNWQSESEQNVLKFIVERSEDGVSYVSVAEIAAFGNSTTARKYNYTDTRIDANEYFYRLKMIDRDGSFKYSGVIRMAISCFKTNSLSVLPNPVQKGHSFKVKIITEQNITKGILTIKNILGQTIQTYPVVVRSGTGFIDYPSGIISAGTYMIELSENNKLVSSCKIIVQ